MNPPRRQLVGAPDVVDVIGIAAVDQDVVGLESRQQIRNRVVDRRGRDHEPNRPRLCQFLYQVGERARADSVLCGHLRHRFWRHVEDHALMASLEQPPHHVGAHPAEADHSELHEGAPF
jgi:hypothetical protein